MEMAGHGPIMDQSWHCYSSIIQCCMVLFGQHQKLSNGYLTNFKEVKAHTVNIGENGANMSKTWP